MVVLLSVPWLLGAGEEEETANPTLTTLDEIQQVTLAVVGIIVLVLVMIGLMGEFYTRRHVSLSWSARR